MLIERVTDRHDQKRNQDALQSAFVKAPDAAFLHREHESAAGEEEKDVYASKADVFDDRLQPAKHGNAAQHRLPDVKDEDPQRSKAHQPRFEGECVGYAHRFRWVCLNGMVLHAYILFQTRRMMP